MRSTLERFAFREVWAKRTKEDFAELDLRIARLAAARDDGDMATVVDHEIALHSWVFELSGHTLLQASWTNFAPLVRLYLSIHQQKFGTHGVFMPENIEYCELAKGSDLSAMLAHVDEHMKLGLEEIIKSVDFQQAAPKAKKK
ncbi:FCD domain-containing protein [Rhodobacteraceae bacterium KMM 6894]|nr:FCD domain-containing protein [Rhodobacteraceae bacterium KMM 6894]